MKCSSCGRENRSAAKYCRFCGEEIVIEKTAALKNEMPKHEATVNADISSQSSVLENKASDGFIGHENIRSELNKFITKLRIQKKQEAFATEKDLQNTIMLFSGNTGTGKFSVAQWFTEKLKKDKIISGKTGVFYAKELKAKFPDEFALKSHLEQNKYAVLIVREVHFDTEYLGEILRGVSLDKSGLICICIGIKNKLDSYFTENPDNKQRVNSFFEFKNYDDQLLFFILEDKLKKHGMKYSADVAENLSLYVIEMNNSENKAHENGWLIEKDIIPKIRETQADRLCKLENPTDDDFMTVLPEDIPVKNKKQTKEEIFAELDSLIGLADAKNQIRELMNSVEAAKARVEKGLGGEIPKVNILFIGKPGTGKTTVARKLGKLFNAIGLLPSSKVIEVVRSKLVAEYVGQTAIKVNAACDSAIGGILFIDEAYSIKQSNGDSFGQEAVDTLVKRIEDDRGKYVTIMAGYKKEMSDFIASNSGLESRFTHTIKLPDYTADELAEIFKLYAKNQDYILSDDAVKKVQQLMKKVYDERNEKFANARTVRNIFDATIRRQNNRVMQLPIPIEEQTKEILQEITAEDILLEDSKDESKEEILKELNSMIGLDGVKKRVHELMVSISMAKERAEISGGVQINPIEHIVLTGNPGTGKTTVARILGKLYKAIGLLPNSKFVEVKKSELVAGYVGQTAPLVNSVCDKAVGGTLFIDEAYSLTQGGDSFGQEAVNTLLKRMEDDRGKFVVIVAGYKKEMEEFIQTNPGLKSRFTTFLHLEDYNTDELFSLFEVYAKKGNFSIADDAKQSLHESIAYIYDNRGADFANGRTIRNFYESVIVKQSSRLEKIKNVEDRRPQLAILTGKDISDALDELKERYKNDLSK